MNLTSSITWMFAGSVFIGIFLNAMNFLADDYQHIYFSSTTLVYSALLMASLMSILEVLMHYSHSGVLNKTALIAFLGFASLCVYLLIEQIGVDDENWLKRMISHHSTALTTSKKIVSKTKNQEVKELATTIIAAQQNEIKIMKRILNNIK